MYDTKHPVILPDDHKVTELIVLERQKVFHNSFAEALSQVRSQVWLIRDRQVAKKVLLYPSPAMSNFWEFRVNEVKALQVYRDRFLWFSDNKVRKIDKQQLHCIKDMS